MKELESPVTAEELALSRRLGNRHKMKILSVSILGALTLQSWNSPFPFFPEPYFSLLHGLTFTGLFAQCFTYPVHLLSLQAIRALGKGLSAGIQHIFRKGSLEEKLQRENPSFITFYETLTPLTRDPLLKRRMSVSLALLQRQYETAFRRALPLFTLREKKELYATTLKILTQGGSRLFRIPVAREKNLQSNLYYGLHYLSIGALSLAKQHLSVATTVEDPQRISVHCFYAHFLHHVLPAEAPAQWQKTIDLLLHDPASQRTFRRLGVSKHEVLEVQGGILQGAFIFKRNTEREGLEREYALNRLMHPLFTASVRIPESLHFTAVDNLFYYAMRRASGVPLPNVTLEDREQHLRTFFSALAGYHATLDHAHASFDSLLREKNYDRALTKIVRRLGESVPEQTMTAYATLLAQQPRSIIHGDFHPNNVLASQHDYTILDPEYMMRASVHLDLAAFLEHDALQLERGQIHTLLQNYYDAQDSHRGSFDAFLHDYYPASLLRMLQVQSALTASSYGMNEETRASTKDHYKKRGKELLTLFSAADQHRAEPLRHLEILLTETSA